MSFASFFRQETVQSQDSDEVVLGSNIEAEETAMLDVVYDSDDHRNRSTVESENESTNSESFRHSEAQALLRQQILSIQNDNSTSEIQKAILMQTLMTRNYVSLAYSKPATAMQEIGHPLSALDQAKTYFDEASGILGCPHYQRNCKLQ